MKSSPTLRRSLLAGLITLQSWSSVTTAIGQEPSDGGNGNSVPQHNSSQEVPTAPSLDDRPWPQKIGIRSAAFARQWPAVDTVVLVPDLATWLDEIMKWSMETGRWPVLIEDEYYTRLFVRRFAPRTIIRRTSIGLDLPENPEELEALVRRKRVAAWAGEPAVSAGKTMNELFRESQWPPPGIVATSFSDPAWPAAVTLAIARGQLLRTLDEEYREPFGTIDGTDFTSLQAKIEAMFADAGWTWGKLGDQLQTLTICRAFPVRAKTFLPPSARMNLSGVTLSSGNPPIAVTDLICRDSEFNRYAICGWIFGDHLRSIYMAMCSVVIDRDSVALFSAYENRPKIGDYRVGPAGQALRKAGFDVVSQTTDRDAKLEGWRRLVMGGVQSDVLFMNTSGRNSQLEFSMKTAGGSDDIPALHKPLALHMIHSYSLQFPANPHTIGTRWLDRGVYAYVGSCEEPFLAAFRTPLQVVQWITNYAPFLVAARQYRGEMSKPWRVVSIGDPLMLIERPGVNPVERVAEGRPLLEGELDLRSEVLRNLRDFGTADAATYRDLVLLNQDELVLSLWKRDRDRAGSSDAEAVLPLLFEQGKFSEFIEAYRLIDDPNTASKEMLWTIYQPRISEIDSVIDLEMLEGSLRSGIMVLDLKRIMPEIIRLKGDRAARDSITSAIEMATSQTDKNRLRPMLQEY
ncbi:MAG: hypothetical protein VX641_06070 [Planctomycetota bacterium]|nr:hypothetical protein [Planctomycetota bacterium]